MRGVPGFPTIYSWDSAVCEQACQTGPLFDMIAMEHLGPSLQDVWQMET